MSSVNVAVVGRPGDGKSRLIHVLNGRHSLSADETAVCGWERYRSSPSAPTWWHSQCLQFWSSEEVLKLRESLATLEESVGAMDLLVVVHRMSEGAVLQEAMVDFLLGLVQSKKRFVLVTTNTSSVTDRAVQQIRMEKARHLQSVGLQLVALDAHSDALVSFWPDPVAFFSCHVDSVKNRGIHELLVCILSSLPPQAEKVPEEGYLKTAHSYLAGKLEQA